MSTRYTAMQLKTQATPSDWLYILTAPRAIDGDTIEAQVHLGFDVHLTARFRLKGFYAPELNGGMPDQGLAAQKLLQAALEGKALAFRKRGSKKDNCGRWLITLLIDGVAADPFTTIFPYQMTEENHAADLRAQKANQGRAPR